MPSRFLPVPAKACLIGLASAAVLAACGEVRPFDDDAGQQAQAAQRELVGLAETDLRACAGEPDSVTERGGERVLVYRNERTLDPSTPAVGYGFRPSNDVFSDPSRFGVSTGAGVTSQLRSFYCEAVFTIRNGTVAGLEYATPASSDFSRLNQCYSIVSGCL
jgi:hypothetical protein